MIEAIVGALLHAIVVSLILSAVLYAAVAIAVRAVAFTAATRHALWMIALIASVAMPLAGIAVSAVRARLPPGAGPTPTVGLRVVSSESARRAPTTGVPSEPHDVSEGAGPASIVEANPVSRTFHLSRSAAVWIVAVWATGALAGCIELAAGLVRVRGLKRRSSPLEGALAGAIPWLTETRRARETYLRLSYEIETPVAIGFRRPVILIPTDLATRDGLTAIEPLVMHEYAHLAHYDDWTNLAQRAIERILWFNPLTWLAGRRIALEREIAADEAVVARTGEPAAYAQSLWQLAREMRLPAHTIVAPGAFFTRKQITIRIETLLASRATIPASGRVAACATGVAALACVVFVASSAPALEPPVAVARPAEETPRIAIPPVPPTPPELSRLSPPVRREFEAAMRIADASIAAGETDLNTTLDQLPSAIRASVSAGLADAAQSFAEADGETPPLHERASGLRAIVRSCRSGCDLHGRDLRGADLRGLHISRADLSGSDLRGARFDNSVLTVVNLSHARLTGASLVNARFVVTAIDGVSLQGTQTRGLTMSDVSLSNMDLHGLDVRALIGSCAVCDLSGANLRGDDLRGVRLARAVLERTDFTGAKLDGADFSMAYGPDAVFDRASLTNARFDGATLHGSSFQRANISGATFTNANVSGATF